MDRLAQTGNPNAIAFPRAWLGPESLDFSFSGLKTSVMNAVRTELDRFPIEDWAASLQAAIVDVLVAKTLEAARRTGVRQVMAAGGVAANSGLKKALADACSSTGLRFSIPPPILCTDNAAMIACAGYYHLQAGAVDDLSLDTLASERLA